MKCVVTPVAGFSLIELALVTVVLGVLAGGMIASLDGQLRVRHYRETERTLARVELALEGFAIANGARLPCPDTDGDGFADRAHGLDPSGPCQVAEGQLPWVTLGVGRADGWGRVFRYRPDSGFVSLYGIPNPPNSVDGLAVRDAEAGRRLTLANPHAPAAVVFSCGRNGRADGFNAETVSGCSAPISASVLRPYAHGRPGADFDDVTVWISKNVLLGRLVAAGEWPR